MSERADLVRAHLERITDLMDDIDDLRQRVTDAMEFYGTSVSARQSQVINRLTIISAIFLPLTFLTGYFGMNFQWLLDGVHSPTAYLCFGVGLFVATFVATLLIFRSRGWLGQEQPRKPQAESAALTPLARQTSEAQKNGSHEGKL
jgi:magnesium transporter